MIEGLPVPSSLGSLRLELGTRAEGNLDALPALFDRYMEAVAIRSNHRLELVQAHLESGFDRVADAVRDGELLEAKSLALMLELLERRAKDAKTLSDLFGVYRRAVAEVVEAIAHPRDVRKGHSLRRAEEFIRRNYSKRLSLARVAQEAGFTRTYFSELFHKKLGVTFAQFVHQLRLQRARHLLTSTSLTVERVAQLSGLGSREYLSRTFKRALGETPLQHRRRARAESRILVEPTLPGTERRAGRN